MCSGHPSKDAARQMSDGRKRAETRTTIPPETLDGCSTLPVQMRSTRTALLAGVLAWLAVAACQAPGPPVPPDPGRVGLQAGDLPASLKRCPASGAVDGYLRSLQAANRAAHDELAAAWQDLKRRGAAQAAVTVYGERPTACTARLGTGEGASVSTMVVTFQAENAASDTYQRGFLGFTTLGADQEVDDMKRGAATGIGRNAWVLQRSVQGRALIVGLWERDQVAVLFIAVDEDPLHAKQALSSVDGRIP